MSKAGTLKPTNGNSLDTFARDYRVARGAGGMTTDELRRKKIFDPETGFWLDDHSGLWIRHGILLFRPWLRKAKPTPAIDYEPVEDPYKRDHMQLED